MDDLYKNKYRIASARHQHWDYRWAASYFITICTHNRAHYFGEIEHETMILSNMGVIADLLWYEIKNHAKQIELGEFVVMPNHIHGILILNNDNVNNDDNANDNVTVETGHALSLPTPKSIGQSRYQNIGKNSISSIVGGYKSAVTKHANRLGFDFKWQSRFHDHIIRDDQSFQNISQYIINNPANWDKDKFYK